MRNAYIIRGLSKTMQPMAGRSVAALIVLFLAFAVPAGAKGGEGLSVRVKPGLGGYFKLGTWTPVQVIMENKGPSFDGVMELSVAQGSRLAERRSTETFRKRIYLPEYGRVAIDITAHLGNAPRPLLTVVKDSTGKVVLKEETSVRHSMTLSDVSLVIGASSGYDGILGAGPGVVSRKVAYLTPQEFPGSWLALRGVSTIVANGIRSLDLGTAQLTALTQWVDTGGHLVIADGTGEKPVQALASALLPVFLAGRSVPVQSFNAVPGTGGKPLKAPQGAWVTVSLRKPGSSTPWRTVDDPNLGSSRPLGRGRVTYLPWDPVGRAFGSWSEQKRVWSSLLPDPQSTPTPAKTDGDPSTGAHRLMPDVGTAYRSRWSLLLLVALHVGGLGLLARATTVREGGTTSLSGAFWGLALIQTLVFGTVGYLALGLPGLRRNTGLTEVSLLMCRPGTRYVEVESFINGFSPKEGEFNMTFRPGVQGLVQTTRSGGDWPDTRFSLDGAYQTVTMRLARWSSFDMLSASVVPNPVRVQGPGNTVKGRRRYRRYTITNMASQPITDAAVVFEERTIELGTMEPYAKREVLLPMPPRSGDMVPVIDPPSLSMGQGRGISRESAVNRERALDAVAEGYHNPGAAFIGWLEKPVWDLVRYGGLRIRASVGLVMGPLEAMTDGFDDAGGDDGYEGDAI